MRTQKKDKIKTVAHWTDRRAYSIMFIVTINVFLNRDQICCPPTYDDHLGTILMTSGNPQCWFLFTSAGTEWFSMCVRAVLIIKRNISAVLLKLSFGWSNCRRNIAAVLLKLFFGWSHCIRNIAAVLFKLCNECPHFWRNITAVLFMLRNTCPHF